jgi:uncharacterized protein (DUF2141 family)
MCNLLSLWFYIAVYPWFVEYTEPVGVPVFVEVQDLRHERGQLAILLFDDPNGFPKSPERAVRNWKFPLGKGRRFELGNIPKGRYALSVIHDENANARLDANPFGIPREPYGFSNNPKAVLGPPDFHEAAFELQGKALDLRVKMIHW